MDKSPKILIIDDDADTLDAYSHLLRAEGDEVLIAPSALECLRLTRQERPYIFRPARWNGSTTFAKKID